MRAVDVIRKKRDGNALDRAEIEAFVAGVTSGDWPDYQASALLMAIVLRGMTAEETSWLTAAMIHSGATIDLSDIPGRKVDKHSTGGVGDKTSLILAPLAAACGVIVPMMSGRGLGYTGGTLDKLESIPGFCVRLTIDQFHEALRAVSCALIGQTHEIAPADRKLYALRDVTGTIESVPLITASILSKKGAEGIDALVLDVKCGRGAFMKTSADARRLGESLVSTGRALGLRTEALLTTMEVPLGRMIGHSLEVIESAETLKGRGPKDLETLSVLLAARMVHLAGHAATLDDAEAKVRDALVSGRGLEKLRQVIVQQGGNPRVLDDYAALPSVPHRAVIRAERSGYVTDLHAELIARATAVLGAGRDRVEDAIDHGVGAKLLVQAGEPVKARDGVIELHYGVTSGLEEALELCRRACVIGEAPPEPLPLVLETLDDSGQ